MFVIEVVNNDTNEVIKRCLSLDDYTDYALASEYKTIIEAIENDDTKGNYSININRR